MQDNQQRTAYISKIKTDDNLAKFWKNKQNSEKFVSATSKIHPVNVSETSGGTSGIHERVADSLQSF